MRGWDAGSGYRKGYELLPRIWITDKTRQKI